MSSNQTTNYGLHQWQPGDTFLRSEINENFAALDAAVAAKAAQSGLTALQTDVAGKAEVVFGTYMGNGASTRTISLGFTPKAVIVTGYNGQFVDSGFNYGGMALSQSVTGVEGRGDYIKVVEGGFQITNSGYSRVNHSEPHFYIAFV